MQHITRASIEDAAAILDLQTVAYQREAQLYNDFSIPPLTQTLGELSSDFASKVFLKARVENRIVGSVRAYQADDTCWIERLIVHPQYQRQGIGSALMQQIEARFGQAQRFELFTGHKSQHNIQLYERLGYTIFRREQIHTQLSFVFMEKHS